VLAFSSWLFSSSSFTELQTFIHKAVMRRSITILQCAVTLFVSIMVFGCGGSQKPFNAEEWNDKGVDWWMTDVRERMVRDIIESDTLIGLRKEEVIALLGRADKVQKADSNTLYIFVREKYSYDIDPDYIKYLKIELNDNERVQRVSEYKLGE